MKRVWKSILLWSVLAACLCGWAAAESYLLEDDYAEIKACYDSAVELSSYQPKKALEELQEIVRIYEGNKELEYFMDATEYYSYAKGRIAVENGQYAEAAGYFAYCSDTLYEKNAYVMFAQGMQYLARKDYERAASCLTAARSCRELSSLANRNLQTCNSQYFEALMQDGAQSCAQGEHEQAMEHYAKAMDLVPTDATAQTAYQNCRKHLEGNEDAEEAVNLKAAEVSAQSVRISWTGKQAAYYLTVSCGGESPDFGGAKEGGKDTSLLWTAGACWKVASADGSCSVVVEGLYPGTQYTASVWTLEEKQIAQQELVTDKARRHDTLEGRVHTLWRYDKDAAASTMRVMAAGTTLHAALYPKDKTHRIGDNATVDLSETPLSREGCYVNITLRQQEWPAEELTGKSYQVLLRAGSLTAGLQDALPGDDIVPFGGNKLCIVLDELFGDMAVESGTAYTVEVLVDGGLMYTFSGTIK